MKRFIEEHKDQAPLDLYLNQGDGKTQIINFNFAQNNYSLILAKIAKLDPEKWLEDLENLDLSNADKTTLERWKEKLSELIIQVSKTIEEVKAAGDYEHIQPLEELRNKATKLLKEIISNRKAVEPQSPPKAKLIWYRCRCLDCGWEITWYDPPARCEKCGSTRIEIRRKSDSRRELIHA